MKERHKPLFRLSLPTDQPLSGGTTWHSITFEHEDYDLLVPAGWPISQCWGHPEVPDGDWVLDTELWEDDGPGRWEARDLLEPPHHGVDYRTLHAAQEHLIGHAILVAMKPDFTVVGEIQTP